MGTYKSLYKAVDEYLDFIEDYESSRELNETNAKTCQYRIELNLILNLVNARKMINMAHIRLPSRQVVVLVKLEKATKVE